MAKTVLFIALAVGIVIAGFGIYFASSSYFVDDYSPGFTIFKKKKRK